MHIPRGHKRGEGVGLFISNRLTNIKMFDTQRFSTFEHMQLSLMLGHNQVLTFIVVYRHPETNKNLFIEEFTIYLESLDHTHNKIYINGDFNLWVDNDQDRYARNFLNLMVSHHFVNEVSGSTSRSGHTLDLVFGVSDVGKILELKVDPDFSISLSHKIITYRIDVKKPEKTEKTITFRSKRNLNVNELLTNIIGEISVESGNACPHASECKRVFMLHD